MWGALWLTVLSLSTLPRYSLKGANEGGRQSNQSQATGANRQEAPACQFRRGRGEASQVR